MRRLDATGADAFWQAIKQRTLALLDLHQGDHVLDVGCGTGDDVRILAQVVGGTGRAVGMDSSATMIAEARKRAEETGLPVEFYQGDAHRLDFPDERFDACRVERVFQHLEDPRRAFLEIVRVARSGGRIVIVEPDYGAQAITGADPAVTRKILQHRCQYFRSGTIGRRLPELYKELKLTDIAVTLVSTRTTSLAGERERDRLRKLATRAQAAGVVSAAEGEAWLAELDEAGKVGRYRRATPIFLVGGRKP